MEDCPDTVQRDPHARPPALAQLGTQSDEESFDVRPGNIGSDGIFVDGLKSPALLGTQPHSVIIRHYAMSKEGACRRPGDAEKTDWRRLCRDT